METSRNDELKLIANRLREQFDSMTTDEVVSVMNYALCGKHTEAPLRLLWELAESVKAEKMVIKHNRKTNKIECQLYAPKGGQLDLHAPEMGENYE